jgi:prephenate dehydrogenase
MAKIKSISIIGLGLIGGSMALALKNKNHEARFFGVDNNSKNANKALELGIVDELKTLEDLEVLQSDLINLHQ